MKHSIKEAFKYLGLAPNGTVTVGEMRQRYKDCMIENTPEFVTENNGSELITQHIQAAKELLELYFQEQNPQQTSPTHTHTPRKAVLQKKTSSLFLEFLHLYTSYAFAFIRAGAFIYLIRYTYIAMGLAS